MGIRIVMNVFCILLLVSISSFIFLPCISGYECPRESELHPCTCSQKIFRRVSTNGNSSEIATSGVTKTRNLRRGSGSAPVSARELKKRRSVTFSTDAGFRYITVQCISPRSLQELEEKVSTALYRKWVDKLVVSNIPPEKGNTLSRLPRDWLVNVRIRHLELKNMQLIGDFLEHGSSLADQKESLWWISVRNCSLSGPLTGTEVGTVETNGLRHLRRLEGLDFSSNRLTAIWETAFKYAPPKLHTLIFARNNIQFIAAGAFQNLTSLKHLDLSHNLLTLVQRSNFASCAIVLEYMDLSCNSIRSLPGDLFQGMPHLKSVNISQNYLFTLPARPWAFVWRQVISIDVSGNFLECNCDLNWLLPILLPRGNVSTVPKAPPGQTLKGHCSRPLRSKQLQNQIIKYDLSSLTKRALTATEC